MPNGRRISGWDRRGPKNVGYIRGNCSRSSIGLFHAPLGSCYTKTGMLGLFRSHFLHVPTDILYWVVPAYIDWNTQIISGSWPNFPPSYPLVLPTNTEWLRMGLLNRVLSWLQDGMAVSRGVMGQSWGIQSSRAIGRQLWPTSYGAVLLHKPDRANRSCNRRKCRESLRMCRIGHIKINVLQDKLKFQPVHCGSLLYILEHKLSFPALF